MRKSAQIRQACKSLGKSPSVSTQWREQAEGFGSCSGSEVLWPRRALWGCKEGPRLCQAMANVPRLLTCPRWWAVREQYRGSAKWQWFFCHPPLRGRRCCGQRGSNGLSCSAGEGGGELRAGSGCRNVELLAWEPFLVLQ